MIENLIKRIRDWTITIEQCVELRFETGSGHQIAHGLIALAASGERLNRVSQVAVLFLRTVLNASATCVIWKCASNSLIVPAKITVPSRSMIMMFT